MATQVICQFKAQKQQAEAETDCELVPGNNMA